MYVGNDAAKEFISNVYRRIPPRSDQKVACRLDGKRGKVPSRYGEGGRGGGSVVLFACAFFLEVWKQMGR